MPDSFTEVSSQSWFSRLGASFKNILFGVLLFALAIVLLFWNEGRAVKMSKALDEASANAISIPSDTVDPANNGKLVHVSGDLVVEGTLQDQVFSVETKALRLNRQVKMLQWVEKSSSKTQNKLGGGTETTTTYNYEKEWSSRLVASNNFKIPQDHQNPATMPYEQKTFQASHVELGAFVLSPSLISKVSGSHRLDLQNYQLPESLQPKPETPDDDDGNYWFRQQPQPTTKFTVSGEEIFMGQNPAAPAIGDMKIYWDVTEPTTVSLIATQNGKTFQPFVSHNGKNIELLENGTKSSDLMLQNAKDQNSTLTWILRFVGFFMMFMGLGMVFKPLAVVADVVPLFGSIVGMGTSLVAFLISATVSLIVIALAWIVYRPIIGIGLLVAAAVGIFFLIKMKKAKAPVVNPV